MIIYNPGSSPVVYSEDGKILGGDDRIEVGKLDKHGRRAVDHGYLLILDEEKTEEETASTEEEETAGKDASVPRARAAKAKAAKGDSGASTGSDVN